MGMDLEVWCENGCGKLLFLSEEVEEGQDLKNRTAHRDQGFPRVSPPPPGHLQRNICLVDTS